jgi:hypothetical protein
MSTVTLTIILTLLYLTANVFCQKKLEKDTIKETNSTEIIENSEKYLQQQKKISLIINDTMAPYQVKSSNKYSHTHSNRSCVQKPRCHASKNHDSERVGCCLVKDVTYLYNIKIEDGNFMKFNDDLNPSTMVSNSQHVLKPLISVFLQEQYPFNMVIKEKYSKGKFI